MRILFILLLLSGIVSGTCFAATKEYVVVQNDTVLGVCAISDNSLSAWGDYTLVEAGEEFKGRFPAELKFEGGEVKHKEWAEQVVDKEAKEAEMTANVKKKLLDDLDITEEKWNDIKK